VLSTPTSDFEILQEKTANYYSKVDTSIDTLRHNISSSDNRTKILSLLSAIKNQPKRNHDDVLQPQVRQ
jgi:hypothetical protein